MAALTRSASLADLSEKEGRKTPKDGDPSRSNTGSEKHRSRSITHRMSAGNNASRASWKWISNSRSFHEHRSRSQKGGSVLSSDSALPADSATFSKPTGVQSQATPSRHKQISPRLLEHLETLLPKYCIHLTHPTYQEAAKAMRLLLDNPPPVTAIAEVAMAATFIPGSPEKKSNQRARENEAKATVKSEMNRLLASPFRSRKPRRDKLDDSRSNPRQWGAALSSLGSQSSASSVNNSHHHQGKSSFVAKLDAAAWESFVAPLILLAGAEAIYADLEHVHPTPSIIHWPGLYRRIASELRALVPRPQEKKSGFSLSRTVPTLDSPPTSPLRSSSASLLPPAEAKFNQLLFPPPNMHRSADSSGISQTPLTPKTANTAQTTNERRPQEYMQLRSLLAWLDVKRQWLPFHESLFLTWNVENLAEIRDFAASLPQKQEETMRPLDEALRLEVLGTLSLMEMAFWLERGRFLETIVSARKVKQQLIAVGDRETALVLWMKTTFQDYLSIMPLVYDKVLTFATPLYGFDQQILLEATQKERTFLNDQKGVADLDAQIIELLRKQERAGGTSMAVAIVLDTGIEDVEEENPAPTSATHQTSRTLNWAQSGHHHHRVELGFSMQTTLSKNHAGGGGPTSRKTLVDPNAKSSGGTDEEQKSTNVAELRPWPAVYLRSTMRLGTPTRGGAASNTGGGMGLINGIRRNASSTKGSSSALDGGSSSQHGSSLHSSRSAGSVDGSPRSKYRKSSSTRRCSLLSHGNIFEYETEPSNGSSWPHSEWGQLRSFLEALSLGDGAWSENFVTDHVTNSPNTSPGRMGDTSSLSGVEPTAVTFHPDGIEPTGEGSGRGSTTFDSRRSILSSDLGKQLWDPLPTPLTTASSSNVASSTAPTTFHAVQINNFMWMIVMVKCEEESRWHRRRSRGVPDREIREFLNHMAAKLAISNRFLGLKTCQTARVKVRDRLAPRVRGRDLGLRDAQWESANPEDDDQAQEDVLQLMKEAFSVTGSHPTLNRAESILTTMSGGFRASGGSRSPRDRRRVLAMQKQAGPFANNSDYREGAAMLFLGPELFRQFLESTSE
ncbi:expressed unknown protein [Seminavis robusta]|uniref:Uncharacterized protein n=1 Tax=Seminavis robusta TaxID=568900 RepID=A0A9N8HNU9_9STRA|nr:expressed unknown protein [Seminavis robusta]|eukprot:Sro851_g210870.1 n/a (1071) ;mRNA; f:22987-26557